MEPCRRTPERKKALAAMTQQTNTSAGSCSKVSEIDHDMSGALFDLAPSSVFLRWFVKSDMNYVKGTIFGHSSQRHLKRVKFL